MRSVFAVLLTLSLVIVSEACGASEYTDVGKSHSIKTSPLLSEYFSLALALSIYISLSLSLSLSLSRSLYIKITTIGEFIIEI